MKNAMKFTIHIVESSTLRWGRSIKTFEKVSLKSFCVKQICAGGDKGKDAW